MFIFVLFAPAPLPKRSTAAFLLRTSSLKEIEKTLVSFNIAWMEIYLAHLGTVTVLNSEF